jgi:hypothetical protein
VAKVQKTAAHVNHLQRQSPVQRQSPASASVGHSLLELQRSIGNYAVQRFIRSPYIQRKLQISTPGDRFEQEADRVADTVMRMSEPQATATEATRVQAKPLTPRITPLLQRAAEQPLEDEKEEAVASTPVLQPVPLAVREDDDEEKMATKLEPNLPPQEDEKQKTVQTKLAHNPPVQRQAMEGEETEEKAQPSTPPIQRQMEDEEAGQTKLWRVQRTPISGVHSLCGRFTGHAVQRLCTECAEEKQQAEGQPEQMVQRKTALPQIPDDEDTKEQQVQRKGPPTSTPRVTTSLAANIHSLNGSGSRLPDTTRAFFEPRFGADFSRVRVHTDVRAAETANAINARAFTVGPNIAFGAGQYAPESHAGRQILAHELTHVLQQGSAASNSQAVSRTEEHVQTYPKAGDIYPSTDKQRRHYSHRDDVIDIQGMASFQPGAGLGNYIASLWENGQEAPVNIKFGSLGSGFIFVKPSGAYINSVCVNIPLGLIGPSLNICKDIPPVSANYQAEPQVIPLKHEAFEENEKGTLALLVGIINGSIYGKLVWIEGKKADEIHPLSAQEAVTRYDEEAFLPLIYGNDYDGKNFSSYFYTNHISSGHLIFNSWGRLSIANQQAIDGFIQLVDTTNFWHATLATNIMGAKEYKLPIDRSSKGDLSGQGDKLTLDETWTGKGFTAKGKLEASFLNSNFFVLGTANYESKRAKGDLLLVVTDYTTAKKYAIEYLPDEIANYSKTDPPPNPSDRLAFAGAGNIDFTLFDGNKQNRKLQVPKKDNVIGDEPEEQPNKALQAFASFVVEPEGYITIAGQVKTKEEEFILFPEKEYKQKIPVVDVSIARIPGPLGTSVDFKFKVDLSYGASIGPATLSEIKAEGLYSNRPEAFSELELSALVKLLGKLFVNLECCISLGGSLLGIFEVELLEACLYGGVAAVGAIQARPTIQVVSPAKDPDRNSPAEYFIRGSFNFDAAGQLVFQLGDSLKINLTKIDDPAKKATDDQKDWKYKQNRKEVTKRYGGKDVEIPMDHTLGSEEIPRVSFGQFAKERFKGLLTRLITQDRPPEKINGKEYFEPGKDVKGKAASTPKDKEIKSGGYEERGEERGDLIKEETKPVPAADKSKYTFIEEFFMNGQRHQLHLAISQQVDKSGKTDFEAILMMESELEEISEKIEEEKKDIQSHPDPAANFRKKDIESIEAQANRVKTDAKQLGIDNELSNKAQIPALKAVAIAVHNYGDRYKKKDLGIPDQTIQPQCSKPVDVHSGQEIMFPEYKGGKNIGRVIEVVSYVTPDGKSAYWHIRFKPSGSPTTTTIAPPAYDENCNPVYRITQAKNCEGIKLEKHVQIVPERIVNNRRYSQSYKADWVKAYPLCWGDEQKPDDDVVGMDRIRPGKIWHRAHLIHAQMGGPGLRWNLIPVPKHINNDVIPPAYENKLKADVQKGISTGKQYWFQAKIIYHQRDDNAVIGHYDDFVKEIRIYYGELQGDAQIGWKFGPAVVKASIKNELDKVPLSDEIRPNRIQG